MVHAKVVRLSLPAVLITSILASLQGCCTKMLPRRTCLLMHVEHAPTSLLHASKEHMELLCCNMEHAFRVLGARAGAALLSCNCLIHLRSHQPRSALPRSPSPGGPIEIGALHLRLDSPLTSLHESLHDYCIHSNTGQFDCGFLSAPLRSRAVARPQAGAALARLGSRVGAMRRYSEPTVIDVH